MAEQQNYTNHVKFVPLFHFFALPVLGLYFLWTLYRLWTSHFSVDGFVNVVVAAALLASLLCGRLFALAVQDRVIRLEERLRFARLLPTDLNARYDELTISQIVSLRFASDAELPELARKVLDERVQDRKQIKQMVKNWRADHLRA
ncbi:MAG: hypothetical protein JSS69_07875 [Acidobacteria bacterium]|nr:hypothetical protein [Acidobacteriota bacterium]MBS1865820.1 hypothetical protein [Acidobacteriota bacterium]